MIRRAIWRGFMSLILIGLSACREYFPTSPSAAVAVKSEFIGLDSLYRTTEGELFAVGFEVKLVDINDSSVLGAPVKVLLEEDKGTLAIPYVTTDSMGIVRVLYYNHAPLTDYTAHLMAIVSGDTSRVEFAVRVRPKPAGIIAEPAVNFLYAPAGKAVETSVAFKVTNAHGVPVPYADVAFQVISGDASIETIAYADINGLVRAYLNVNPSTDHEIVVQAEVRFVRLDPEENEGRGITVKLLKNLPQLQRPPPSRVLQAISTIKVIII